MNRIVRENYPVSRLPEELQEEFAGQDEVTLIVQAKAPQNENREGPEPPYGWGTFSRYRHLAKPRYRTSEEIVDHVRRLRDEWGEREQQLNELRAR